MQKRLGSWTFRMLSFAGRMVVMKHVLKAMPNHLFTWKALRLRQILKVFTPTQEVWTQALQALLQHAVAKRPRGGIHKQWTAQEILLACCPKRIPRAQTTTGLLMAWNEAVTNLKIDAEALRLEEDSHIQLYTSLANKYGQLTQEDAARTKKVLKAARVNTVGQWADWAHELHDHQPLRESEVLVVEHGLHIEVQSGGAAALPWTWHIGNRQKWADLRYLAEVNHGYAPCETTWLKAFDTAFRNNTPASYILVVAILKAIWTERNTKCYASRNIQIPCSVSLRLAADMVEALVTKAHEGSRKRDSLVEASRFVRLLLTRLDRTQDEPLNQLSSQKE
ncbi:hypothetical protein R1sor_016742 [Riccia sorocarpa]|uniref:Uncharacterized protein n=1 Tax=Riccia sorocarpa TaxID=122646 RepID=A0ABD3HGA9_9MARC